MFATMAVTAGKPAVILHDCMLQLLSGNACLTSVAVRAAPHRCRTEQEQRLGLRPRFEILKQRADEYFPLSADYEKPHLRWAAGYPEGPVVPGLDRRKYLGTRGIGSASRRTLTA